MDEIEVADPIITGNRLTCEIQVSQNLKKYVKTTQFFVEYDEKITDELGILSIPLTACVLPLAWLTSADLTVNTLDRRFKESMDQLQKVFSKMYPLIPFKTTIHTNELVQNEIKVSDPQRRTGLLFSGGVDSSYSLITNLHNNPRLLMIWGIDDFPYPQRPYYWEKTIQTYSEFTKKHELDFNVIKTNASQILEDRRIEHDYPKQLTYKRLRPALQHSLVLLPLTAPLSMRKFDRVLIAASADSSYDFSSDPYASVPDADQKIVWADLQVSHHGMIHRYQKINEIGKYLKKDNLQMRVCTKSSDQIAKDHGLINDCTCEKCFRTIINLILIGVNPNKCGFKVDKSTFFTMKTFFQTKFNPYKNYYWKEIQSMIPKKIEFDLYGSKEFLEWFRGFEFRELESSLYRKVYEALPYGLTTKFLVKVYNRLGIKIRN